MEKKNLEFINQKLHDVFNLRGKSPGHDTELFNEILAQVHNYFDAPESLPCTCSKVSCDCPQHKIELTHTQEKV